MDNVPTNSYLLSGTNSFSIFTNNLPDDILLKLPIYADEPQSQSVSEPPSLPEGLQCQLGKNEMASDLEYEL